MKNKTLISSAILCSLLIGCASVQTVTLDESKRPSAQHVDVYMRKDMPTKPYKVIREMSCLSGPGEDARTAKRFISIAKSAGADGVLIFTPEPRGAQWSGFGGEQKFMYRGQAVVYDTTNR